MNKFLIGMTAASALVFSSAALAVPTPYTSVAFDAGSDGAWDLIVGDNTGFDLNPTQNVVVGQFNGFAELNIGALGSNPFQLHMTASMNQGGTMTFGVTTVNLTLADLSSAIFTVGGSGFTSQTTSAYLDQANNALGMGDILIGTSSGSQSPISFVSESYLITDQDVFSVTLVTTITANAAGSIDADILQAESVSVSVPEPSLIALMSLGLVGIGIAGRRKKLNK